ncbi:hypothetical protein Ae201684_002287 [Aphanomyces euteiches]|uniref:PH domain-containing protein n=1 Tax=Aphanomyces euteiches TaxID=100861 RepID=A0A6G0XQU2_9STRA|nr:hypothetical protein Ae201684_002287 [Aphanomyces euteiches]
MMLKKASSSLSSTHSLQIQTQSEGQVAREGWLKKKGHLFSTIKSRFFVLATDGHLAYFKDNKKKKQKGLVVLDMSDTIMPLPTKKHDKVFGFELKKDASGDHNAKAYSLTMFASSDPERTQWIEALRRVTTVQFVPPTPRTPALSVSALSQTVLGTVTSNPRDTFCVLIEIGELQQLVTAAKTTWDIDPLKWSQDQYLELCRSIVFTHEKAANANMSIQESQVLKDALELRYKYEDAQAQVQARRLSVAAPLSPSPQTTKLEEVPEPTSATEHPPAEKTLSDAISLINRPVAKYFASLDPSFVALSPRSKTIAKYAHLYQEEALIAKRAWNILREDSDDVLNAPIVSTTTDDLANLLNERFQRDRIYTNVGNTMLTINPAPRLVHHAAGNSIYDETTVMWYRDHDLAQGSPHPFALAKQTLSSIQDNKQNECIILIGESGSGKTDFGKHVLKYFATVQHALKPPHVQLYTSSTKSTIKMRSDESHLMDLLRSKQITYETIYLDISPEKWPDMLAASGGLKQLPQLHMEKLFFGNYDELQRLEDEEQLVFYLKNPLAARLTSILLDSNILLETFGNARTVHNPNSSRFGKSTTFSVHATTGQLLGGSITPFFLETSRVTNANPDDANFHIFYSLLVGASDKLASECHLKNTTPSTFAYLGKPSKSAPTNVKNFSTEEDRQRWQRVLRCLDLIGVTEVERTAIFSILSAVLYLGNFVFKDSLNALGVATGVKISSAEELKIVASLLSVDINTLERSLCTRQLSVAKKDEVYELQVHEPQARVSRDTLARLLYESLFTTLVSMLNKHSKAHEAIDGKACEITLVDVFGFEDIGFNSFEQLCINYLTERLSSFELDYAGEVQKTLYASEGLQCSWLNDSAISSGYALQVLESPVGVWACLEEATLLHSNEDDQSQAKNSRFVRALYSRNVDHSGLTIRRDPLEFTLNHNRSQVTYNATNFVAKNSDAVSIALVKLVRSSTNSFVKSLRPEPTEKIGEEIKRQSVANRFKGHVQDIIAKLRVARPRFVHCLRPRLDASSDFNSLGLELLKAQIRGQLLPPIVSYSSQQFRHNMELSVFQSRYHMLFKDIFTPNGVEHALNSFVGSLSDSQGASYSFAVGKTTVFMNGLLHDKLQDRRFQVRSSACVVIQATVRMWLASRAVGKLRETTRNYIRDITQFYAKYNPTKLPEVPDIVRAFRGRENVLFEKLQQKYLKDHVETPSEEAIDTSLEDFILKVHFDAITVQQMLLNPKIALLLGEPRILQALREVSIDPSVIYLQTNDPVLRLFYTEMRSYLTTSVVPKRTKYQDMPLEDAVEKLAHLQLLKPLVGMTPEEQDALSEIATDPSLLPFHIDQPGVRTMLQRLIKSIDNDPSTVVAELRFASELSAVRETEPQQEPSSIENIHSACPAESEIDIRPESEPLLSTQSNEDNSVEASENLSHDFAQDITPIDTEKANFSEGNAPIAAKPHELPPQLPRFQDMPLEEAVERLIEAQLLHPINEMTPEDQAIIQEIAMDPPLLAFLIDDPHVQDLLKRLCQLADNKQDQSTHTPNAATLSAQTQAAVPEVVELKRIKITKKLMKKIMNDDKMMTMMGEPKVMEFFEEFSEDPSDLPLISFPANETLLIDFYQAVLQLSQG